MSSEDALGTVGRASAERFGRLDILVNNAGIGGEPATVWETSTASFTSVLAVNLLGTFHGIRAAVR